MILLLLHSCSPMSVQQQVISSSNPWGIHECWCSLKLASEPGGPTVETHAPLVESSGAVILRWKQMFLHDGTFDPVR